MLNQNIAKRKEKYKSILTLNNNFKNSSTCALKFNIDTSLFIVFS